MEDKKQYSTLTIDRAAFLLLRVKKAFKKKKLQKKERERRYIVFNLVLSIEVRYFKCYNMQTVTNKANLSFLTILFWDIS